MPLFILLIFTTTFLHCGPNPHMPAIDVAAHIYSTKEAEALLPIMAREHVEKTVLLGTLPGGFGRVAAGSPVMDNNTEILAIAKKWPQQFVAFPAVSASYQDLLTYANTLVQAGAKGFVVNATRAPDAPLISDSGYEPLYQFLEGSHLPIFLPVDAPRDLVALETVLGAHPKLKVICPHLCTAAQNPKRIDTLLVAHPNLWVDMGASDFPAFEGFLLQASQNAAALRELILQHPDRFLFATHRVVGSSSFANDAEDILKTYKGYRRFLNDAHYDFPELGRRWKNRGMRLPVDGALYGLFLPKEVLAKVYQGNAAGLLAETGR